MRATRMIDVALMESTLVEALPYRLAVEQGIAEGRFGRAEFEEQVEAIALQVCELHAE